MTKTLEYIGEIDFIIETNLLFESREKVTLKTEEKFYACVPLSEEESHEK